MEKLLDVLIDAVPFVIYSALLIKLGFSWRLVFKVKNKNREARLAAILILLAVCTLTFMAANAYVLYAYGKTFLSMRVFQMFVLSNCAAYWLVLDLITKDACETTCRVD